MKESEGMKEHDLQKSVRHGEKDEGKGGTGAEFTQDLVQRESTLT